MPKTANATIRREELPRCWVKEGDEYILIQKGGQPDHLELELPCVGIRYENILKKLQIPYEIVKVQDRKNSNKEVAVCRFWNPEMHELKKERHPVYLPVHGSRVFFVKTEERFEREVISYKTVKQALKTKKIVDREIEEYKRKEKNTKGKK